MLVGMGLLTALAFGAELEPRTLPTKGPKWYGMQTPDPGNGVEMRQFRIKSRAYTALLPHQEILASHEWSPSTELPATLGKIEWVARGELQKLAGEAAEWETSSIQLTRFLPSTEPKWFYVVSFSPVLKVPSLPTDSVVVLLTLDGKPGRSQSFNAGK